MLNEEMRDMEEEGKGFYNLSGHSLTFLKTIDFLILLSSGSEYRILKGESIAIVRGFWM